MADPVVVSARVYRRVLIMKIVAKAILLASLLCLVWMR